MTSRLTILVSGMIAGVPGQGGAVWAVLQYLLGLRQLGHDICFVEPLAAAAFQPEGGPLAASTNATYFKQIAAEFGLADASALLQIGTQETVGLPYGRLREIARHADVLINIAGTLTDQDLTSSIPCRVYLDLDPAFTQLWQAAQGIDMRFADHTHFATVGLGLGQPECPVPNCGLPWIATPQPIVLNDWPIADRIEHDAFTTIANWRGYGSIDHDGVFYGQKAHSLRQFITLPTMTTENLLLALAIHPAEVNDLKALATNGWHLLDPALIGGTPADYRRFIQGSKAEFGVAKSGYVAARCGWFSDRSVCYLASGRPVLAQETGFDRFLPTGEGLLTFTTIEEACTGMQAIGADYARHARAARTIAEDIFDSDKVLARLLDRVGATP